MDNIERGEFSSFFQDISVSGFSIKSESKSIPMKIRAVPINNNWSTIKESNTRVCNTHWK